MTAALTHGDLREMSDEALFAPFELVPQDADFWKEMEEKTTPRHTAQRLKTNDPVKFETLRRALEAGAALTTLAKSHKVGVNTLYAIIDAELGGRERHNASLASKFKTAANMGVDKVMELMPECKSLMEAGVVTGIMADKSLALSGAPGLIVEHRHTDNSAGIETLKKLIEDGWKKVEGRVVEVGTENIEHRTSNIQPSNLPSGKPSAVQMLDVLPSGKEGP